MRQSGLLVWNVLKKLGEMAVEGVSTLDLEVAADSGKSRIVGRALIEKLVDVANLSERRGDDEKSDENQREKGRSGACRAKVEYRLNQRHGRSPSP